MKLSRAKIPESDRRFIIGRSAGCCNKCKIPVFVESEFAERARLGDDAHIWAFSETGPRGGADGAPVDRNARGNILLLCKNCHSEVDQKPIEFSPQALLSMRDAHYQWVETCLGQVTVEKPKFHYITYLNIPRVDMYAVASSIGVPHIELGSAKCFRDLGMAAGRIMAAYSRILSAEDMYAHGVEPNEDISSLCVGQYCFILPSFFRTVSVNESQNLPDAWASDKSVIYRWYKDWKLVAWIDPRWITTSTARCLFRSGQALVCGVVRVSRIEIEKRKVCVSPLFLAEPGGSFDE